MIKHHPEPPVPVLPGNTSLFCLSLHPLKRRSLRKLRGVQSCQGIRVRALSTLVQAERSTCSLGGARRGLPLRGCRNGETQEIDR